jgi:hypothetical protein
VYLNNLRYKQIFSLRNYRKNKSLKQNFQLIHSELSEQLKTKMNKNRIIISLSIGLLIAAVVACTSLYNNDDNNTSRISAEKRAEIEQIGILHNQGLDTILMDFMRDRVRMFQEFGSHSPKLRASAIAETYDYEQLVYNTTKRLMKEWGFVQNEQEFQAIMPDKLWRQVNHSRTRSAADEIDVAEQLTPFQADYYNRIMGFLHRENVTLDMFLSEVAILEIKIERNAPTLEETEQLLYITSVARHTAEYWSENLARWNTMLNSEMIDVVTIDEVPEYVALRIATSGTRSTPWGDAVFMVADPNDPTKFFVIDGNNITRYECPPGLYFCPAKQTCDWREAVIADNPNIWWGFAGADIDGAATGAATGAAAGVAGIGVGAAVGAVVGSGSYAFQGFWNSIRWW